MIEWYKKVVFENYANFNGRARRSEYWYFLLANTIVTIVLSIIDNILDLKIGGSGILNSIYALALFIPGLAVAVRRLHDIGKSGKLLLLFYISLTILAIIMVVSGISIFMPGLTGATAGIDSLGVGFFLPLLLIFAISVWMIVLFATEGNEGENKYGLDPKKEQDEIDEIGVVEL